MVGANVYHLDLPAGAYIHPVFHILLLKPATHHESPLDLVDADRELEYEVEEIIDQQVHQNHKEFLVKWLGYSHNYNKWITEGDIHTDKLVDKFNWCQTVGKPALLQQ